MHRTAPHNTASQAPNVRVLWPRNPEDPLSPLLKREHRLQEWVIQASVKATSCPPSARRVYTGEGSPEGPRRQGMVACSEEGQWCCHEVLAVLMVTSRTRVMSHEVRLLRRDHLSLLLMESSQVSAVNPRNPQSFQRMLRKANKCSYNIKRSICTKVKTTVHILYRVTYIYVLTEFNCKEWLYNRAVQDSH